MKSFMAIMVLLLFGENGQAQGRSSLVPTCEKKALRLMKVAHDYGKGCFGREDDSDPEDHARKALKIYQKVDRDPAFSLDVHAQARLEMARLYMNYNFHFDSRRAAESEALRLMQQVLNTPQVSSDLKAWTKRYLSMMYMNSSFDMSPRQARDTAKSLLWQILNTSGISQATRERAQFQLAQHYRYGGFQDGQSQDQGPRSGMKIFHQLMGDLMHGKATSVKYRAKASMAKADALSSCPGKDTPIAEALAIYDTLLGHPFVSLDVKQEARRKKVDLILKKSAVAGQSQEKYRQAIEILKDGIQKAQRDADLQAQAIMDLIQVMAYSPTGIKRAFLKESFIPYWKDLNALLLSPSQKVEYESHLIHLISRRFISDLPENVTEFLRNRLNSLTHPKAYNFPMFRLHKAALLKKGALGEGVGDAQGLLLSLIHDDTIDCPRRIKALIALGDLVSQNKDMTVSQKKSLLRQERRLIQKVIRHGSYPKKQAEKYLRLLTNFNNHWDL